MVFWLIFVLFFAKRNPLGQREWKHTTLAFRWNKALFAVEFVLAQLADLPTPGSRKGACNGGCAALWLSGNRFQLATSQVLVNADGFAARPTCKLFVQEWDLL